jgi:multidrug resistance efflux pump
MNASVALSLPRALMATWPGRLMALVVVGGLIGGATLITRGNAPAPASALRTTSVTKGSVTQTVSVSGSVNALGQARLSFKTGGKVAQIFVSTGQAVTLGQPLAKLDTTDLETALATAQQNLANAQASYQKTLLSAADAQKSLDDAQRQAATDIANATSALNKVKSSYTAAKFNLTSLTNLARGDISALQTGLANVSASLGAVLQMLSSAQQTNDVKSATNSINQAQLSLNNASAYASNLLVGALSDFNSAQNSILQTTAGFEDAIANNADTTLLATAFSSQQLTYTTAQSRLTGAIDTVTGPLGSVQSSVSSAQSALSSSSSISDYSLEGIRASLQNLLIMLSQTTQSATTAKSRLGQATSAMNTVNDTIQTSYANAVQSLASTNDRTAQSIRNAQSAVANIPFNTQSSQVSVDNANNAVVTAKSNLDNAVLTAPAPGVVASIANQVGEFVSGGNTNSAFIVLTNTTSMVLHGTVGESDVSKLKLGQVANVNVDALGGQKMTGKVTSLDPVATISQGVPVYGIDITIDVTATGLRAGMSGTAAVILASKSNVLTVPNTTIRTVNGQRGVQVLKDGEVVDTAVQFGLSNDTVTEVVSGLAEGDIVVIPQARASASQNRQQQGPGGAPVFIGR